MSGPENKYQKQARKDFLDADSPMMRRTYGIEGQIVYDDRAINIYHENGELLKEYMFKQFIERPDIITKALARFHQTRNRIKAAIAVAEQQPAQSLTDIEQLYNTHFDYEAMIMDKLASVEKVRDHLTEICGDQRKANEYRNSLFLPFDGKTFFEESILLHVLSIGHLLGDERFSRNTDEWFLRRALTKYRLYEILERFSPEFKETILAGRNDIQKNYGITEGDDALHTIATIKSEQFRRKCEVEKTYREIASLDEVATGGKLKQYLEFTKCAIAHNEEMRLWRSRTFYIFSETSQKEGLNPFSFYMECNARRKARIHEEYE